MMRRLLVSTVSTALLTSPVVAQQTPADSIRIAVNRAFAPWSNTDGPGCALGVARDGNVVYQNGYGMANLEVNAPITPNTIFHVASVSKQFTAMAIMLLARDGKLSLDDDIRRHLPELPDYGHKIAIRHLLHHTSGLRDQWDLLFLARGRFEENRITESDVLEIVARQKALNFVPGTEYLYSNTGYTLSAIIVKRVSGKSLREFADERIFKPLAMTNTHFHDDYTMVVKGRAAAYVRGADGKWHVSLPNYDTYGATSLFTTVGDLLKWDANVWKPTVGDDATLREMRTSGTLTSGDTTGYGLGIATEVYRGARLIGHSGGDAGYRTYTGRFPEHGLTIVVLCNAGPANPTALTRAVADVYIGSKLAAVEPPPKAALSLTREQKDKLAGVYVNEVTGAPTIVAVRRDSLMLGRTVGPALVPLTERRFRIAAQPVVLEFMPNGTVVQTILAWPNPKPITLKRFEPARPSRAEMDAYAGTYYSEELGATYSVTATDSTLVFKTRWGALIGATVRPAYGDTFVGDLMVTFTRGRGNKIDGALMSTGRVRKVRFTKAAS
ncbi:MAG: serine hydrolase domain-containing protein [Gemmatimonadaceae bacterium]